MRPKSLVHPSDRRLALACLAALALVSAIGWWTRESPEAPEAPTPAVEVRADDAPAREEPTAVLAAAALPVPAAPSPVLRGKVTSGGAPVPGASVLVLDGAVALLSNRMCSCNDHCGMALLRCPCNEASHQLAKIAAEHAGEARVVASAVSGRDGTFEIPGLWAGKYEVWAEGAQGIGEVESSVPNDEPVEIALSAETVIAGQVVSEANEPIAGAQVTVISGEHRRHFDAETGLDGRFVIGPVPEAEYVAVATLDGKVPGHDVVRAGEPLKLVLRGERRLVGRATDRGQALPGTVVSLSGKKHSEEVKVDATGRFEVGGLLPGKYQLVAKAGLYLAEKVIEIAESPPVTEVELRLEPGAQLIGLVRDERGKPLEGAWVYLEKDSPKTSEMAMSEESGRFESEALPHGEYTVYANADGYVASGTETLELKTGERRTVEFTLRQDAPIRGVVVDEAGEPIEGADVAYSNAPERAAEEDERMGGFSSTGSDGSFALESLPAGRYELSISAVGFEKETLTVGAPAASVRVRLRREPESARAERRRARLHRIHEIKVIREPSDGPDADEPSEWER